MPKTTPRMMFTTAMAILLLAVIALVAPQQLPVTIYKLSLVTLGSVAGYWVDRELFPYARPDCFTPDCTDSFDLAFAAAMIRRAIIVAAFVIGVTLGL